MIDYELEYGDYVSYDYLIQYQDEHIEPEDHGLISPELLEELMDES